MSELNERLTSSIRENATRLAELNRQASEIKREIDTLKGYFEKLAEVDLTDTKIKTITYWGDENSQIVVANSETISVNSYVQLKKLLGDIFGEWVKEEVKYTPNAKFKQLFGAIASGQYTDSSTTDLINSITPDDNLRKVLAKKLKGKFEQDKENLIKLAGLPEQQASDNAYLYAEARIWEQFCGMLKTMQWPGSVQEAIELVKANVMVEDGIKVSIAAEGVSAE